MGSIRFSATRWVVFLGGVLLGLLASCGGGSANPSPPPPPPVISSFTASKSSITVGSGTALTGVFANGTGSVDSGIGPVMSGVAIPVSPGSDRTYTLTVTNGAGSSITAQASVKVVDGPEITKFTATQSPITNGSGTTLMAVFANGTGTVDGGVGPITSGVAIRVQPTADATYTLTVTNADGFSVTAQTSVMVVSSPVITSFTVAQSPITTGVGTTLKAVFSNGMGSVDMGVGSITSGVGIPINPGGDTSYTLTVTNAAGTSLIAKAYVAVVRGPEIVSFTAAKNLITEGSGTTLTAMFTNGTGSVDAGVGQVANGVAFPVAPGADTTYTLTVTNAALDSVEAQVKVRVVTGASLKISLVPISGTWRVGGGSWMASGTTMDGLAPGGHNVEFAVLPYYNPLPHETVTLESGEQRSVERAYVPPTGFYEHRLRFFINQDLVGTLNSTALQARLSQYAGHIQTIFHRETIRRLIFDPTKDISLCTEAPFTPGNRDPWPSLDFELWVYARLTDRPEYGSYGGNMNFDGSGAGGADNLKWDQIHDPSMLIENTPTLAQYWKQIDHIIHELEHVFGAGFGEYYSAGSLKDPTDVEPILPPMPGLNGTESHPFWDARREYWADPLTAWAYQNPKLGSPVSLPTLLSAVRFAPATIGVINGLNRDVLTMTNTLPDLSAVEVRVLDSLTGAPIPTSTLRVWNRRNPGTYGFFENLVNGTTTPGVFTFKWEPYPYVGIFGNYDNAKILKAYAPGYTPHAQWEWLYDAQREKCYYGRNEFKVTIRLTPLP